MWQELEIQGQRISQLTDPQDISVHLTGTGTTYAVMANARGAAAQVRAAWGNIESKYDAILAANPLPDGPSDRVILLVRVRQYLSTDHETREAGAAAVTEFTSLGNRGARWHFSQQGLRWSVTLELGDGNAARLTWAVENNPGGDARFFLRPDVDHRSFHAVTCAAGCEGERYLSAVTAGADGFLFSPSDRLPFQMTMPGTEFRHEPEWLHDLWLPIEAERGLPDRTDLFSPGVFVWQPDQAGATAECLAVAGGEKWSAPEGIAEKRPACFPLPQVMEQSLDLYLARRDTEWSVIAGYPWFLDWGRDSLIFCRGLIAAGRADIAASIARRFAAWELHGSIPNILRGNDASDRETSDAPLWLVQVIRELAAVRPGILQEKCGGRSMAQIACDLVRAHLAGPGHGVRFDPASGLLWSPSHYTWMDTSRPAGTPREGYPVSIQCLWAAALEFAHTLDASQGWGALARMARASVQRLFWRETDGFLADCLHAPAGVAAADAVADDHLRPNQLLAINTGLVSDSGRALRILESCSALLVPGALRTLAPRRVEYPLPVEWDGAGAHDSHWPYHGRYSGPENVSRKAAYHNGTAWPWLLPSFCEALVRVQGAAAIPQARKLMGTTAELLRDGCLGHVAEIVDGDAPHRLRGCGAQAWSASEWVRVWKFLTA